MHKVDATDIDFSTPLHFVAWNGKTEVARLLLDRGVKVNPTDRDGETPLWKAAKCGHIEVAKLLIDEGA